ncbi:MAG: prolyl aminopeptidase [Hyphomicrobiaceae bacterium]
MSINHRVTFYPPVTPYRRGHLAVDNGHEIYFEESGNRNGIPVLVIHGGPGGGSNPTMRRLHDPSRYRIILADQRGCGHSMPNASLVANTTWHLIDDMECLRRHLGITRWQLVGGSWGSTLAIAYAISHPERVSSMLLRGIFLLRRAELQWFYQQGANWLFPDAYADFEALIPPDERSDMIRAYYKRLTSTDPRTQLQAARSWSAWEGSTLALLQDADRIRHFSEDAYALAFSRIECHYFVNGGFLDHDNWILDNIGRLTGIPGLIIHGRYDVVTPIRSAFDLKAGWPDAELIVVPDAGHAMTEPGIMREIIRGTSRFAETA